MKNSSKTKPNKKSEKSAKQKNSAKKKPQAKKRISHLVKPQDMSLEEWQIALRKQIAEDEHFDISCVDRKLKPGKYSVENPKTRSAYKVVFR